MESKKWLILAVTLDVIFLVAAGYLYLDVQSQNEFIASLTEEQGNAMAQMASLENDLKAARSRIAVLTGNGTTADSSAIQRLNKSLDEKDAEITRLKQQLANTPNGAQHQENRRGNNRQRRERQEEFLSRLKQEDPDRYEQIMNDREKRKQEAQARAEKRDNYLKNINTSKLTQEQQQIVSDYKSLLSDNEALRAQMQESGDMSGFREIMRNQMELNQLSESVRDILIEQYAGSNTAEEIKNIIDATAGDGPQRGGPGGFGPPPGGPGGN